MFKNAFAFLQKIGKSLMLPVAILPVAGILLGVGASNFTWMPELVSLVEVKDVQAVFRDKAAALGAAVFVPEKGNMVQVLVGLHPERYKALF